MSSQEEDSFDYLEVFNRDGDDNGDEVISRLPDDETEEEREIRLGGTLVPLAESERMLGIFRDEHGRIIPYDPHHGCRNKITGDDNDDASPTPSKAETIPRKRRTPRRGRRNFSDERLLKRLMEEEEEEDDVMPTEKKKKKTIEKIEGGVSNRVWDEESYKVEKKRKRKRSDEASTSRSPPKKTSPTPRNKIYKSKGVEYTVPDPAPPLPDNVRAKMEEDGPFDGEPVLVLQRILNPTDLSDHHNRLAMPIKQILNNNFLREDEKKLLEEKREDVTKKKKKGGLNKVKDSPPTLKRGFIETRVVLPSLKSDVITLRFWPLSKKGSGRRSSEYVLNGRWKMLLADEAERGEELMEGMVVQIWAYRVKGKLRFALVNLGAFSRDRLGNIIQVPVPIPEDQLPPSSSQQQHQEQQEQQAEQEEEE